MKSPEPENERELRRKVLVKLDPTARIESIIVCSYYV